jgi:hypothetical protein
METFTLHAPIARRMPDPYPTETPVVRHVMYVPVRSFPPELAKRLEPNAREAAGDLGRKVYRDVQRSLLDEAVAAEGIFHLKHSGITMIARSVKETGEDTYEVTMAPGDGIVNGGHSAALIAETPDLPEHQVVKVEILCGVPEAWVVDIAGGLNTSIQVQRKSLDNLAGEFDWLKNEIKNERYADQIVWRENDPGVWDVTYLLSLLACFNIFDYPNEGTKHPVWAYGRKIGVLQQFEQKPDTLKKLQPIARDIFRLHDLIGVEAKDLYNSNTGGKFGKWTFVQKKPAPFVFTGAAPDNQMLGGALFPILGAFRWAVVADSTDGPARWEFGFDTVLDLMRKVLPELIAATGQASQENGRNIHALGRSPNHWGNLHDKVGLRYLQQKQSAAIN